MKKILTKILFVSLLLLTLCVSAQESVTFSGVVGFSDDGSGNMENISKGGWNNNMLTSTNFIASNTDGSVSYTIKKTSDVLAFGLSIKTSSLKVIDITYRLLVGEELSFWKNEKMLGTYGRLEEADVLEIVRIGNKIVFKINDKSLFSLETKPSLTLYLKVSALTESLTIPSGAFFGKMEMKGDCDISVFPEGNIELCPDEQLQLSLSGAGSYLWVPSTGLSCSDCPNPIIDANMAVGVGSYNVTAYSGGPLAGQNLIFNGDFGNPSAIAGSYGFSTGYSDQTAIATPNLSAGELTVIDNSGLVGFPFCVDHTTESGNMLVVNGATPSDELLWSQSVSQIVSGETYVFSFWVQNNSRYFQMDPKIKVLINSETIGGVSSLGLENCSWKKYSFTWEAKSNQALIEMRTQFSDKLQKYAIDDISFMSKKGKCGSKNLTVIVKDQCNPDPEIIGCVFANFGAGVYVSPTAKLNVYCNFLNELGGLNGTTGLIEEGQFENHGDINVSLDWINNVNSNGVFVDVITANNGVVDLIGDDQRLRGSSTTDFFTLQLCEEPSPFSGNGVKSLNINQNVHNKLDLKDSELAVGDHTLYFENNAKDSLLRVTGYISTDGIGYLSRALNSNNDPNDHYFFPMGSNSGATRYRPLEIFTTTGGKYVVNFQNEDPFSDGLTSLSPSVLSINDKFYHNINNEAGNLSIPDATVRSYYAPGDGVFQALSHWKNSNPWWESTYGQGSSSTLGVGDFITDLYYAETVVETGVAGPVSFDGEPYVLANAGFVIGTGNWPSTGGTTGGSNPGGVSNGCVAAFTYTNYNPQVVFTSTAVVSNAATYLWTLDDGTTGSGAVYTHTYSINGTYSVQLDITDGFNTCSVTATVVITNAGSSSGSSSGGSSGSTGNCLVSFTSVTYDPQVVVAAIAATGAVSPIYTWDFGDGNSSIGQAAANAYSNNGAYTITLTVTDASNGSISCTATEQISIANASGIVITVEPEFSGPCGQGGNMGTGMGTGGNNTSTTGGVPCDYVMTIQTNDNCRLDGDIYFTIADDLSLETITYSTDGGTNRFTLSPEVYDEIPGVPGFFLTATPKELLESCINTTSVSMGLNNDFVLRPTESIIITSPFTVSQFSYGLSGSALSLSNQIVPGLPSGVYEFELILIVGAGTETIKGQFIAKP